VAAAFPHVDVHQVRPQTDRPRSARQPSDDMERGGDRERSDAPSSVGGMSNDVRGEREPVPDVHRPALVILGAGVLECVR
jgi:hypothetical protein